MNATDNPNDGAGTANVPNSDQRRLGELSAAILRMSEGLDVDNVLREAVEGARALTGAKYGFIATVDEWRRPVNFVTSGASDETRETVLAWPDGPKFFQHLSVIESPLVGDSLPDYVQSLGLSPLPIEVGPFQLTPMRHRGTLVDGFFIVSKEGAFSEADASVLGMLAAQAAAAIENAHVHREVQRARSDLEALVETSPVGVVVFDAVTAAPMSVNAAARRIVADLNVPIINADTLRTITCRRSDGRTVELDEIPRAETLRAEEVELSEPSGRSVRTLLNVTPISSPEGTPQTVVVTLQDLAPFEALERARTEFLTMVSHELRAPLTAVKGSAVTVLGSARTLEPTEVRQFFRIVEDQADRMDRLIGELLDAGRLAMGTLAVAPAPESVVELVEQARRTFLGGTGAHDVQIDLAPDLPKVMADAFRIGQVLDNLLTNATRYAPPSTPIHILGSFQDGFVHLSVRDEGESLDADRLKRMFDRYSGDGKMPDGAGLGLAICRGLVEAHGGRIQATYPKEGRGTQITFTLPVAEPDRQVESRAVESTKKQTKTTVLVLDDDPQTLRYVQDALNSAGYTTVVTGEPGDVAELLRTHRPQLVLLDLVLPGTDGIQLMRDVSELTDLPVIFVSAYGRGDTIAQALEAGAADYIVKPFSAAELIARARAALRRHHGLEPFVLGGLTIDYERRRVSVSGHEVALTVTEYEVLRVLSINVGRVMSYDALTRQVWRDPDLTSTGTVRGLIKRLRRKLNDPANSPRYIVNERGIGYRMPRPSDG